MQPVRPVVGRACRACLGRGIQTALIAAGTGVAAFLSAAPAHAADARWTAAYGNWNNADNWSTGVLPDASTNVSFATSGTAVMSDGAAATAADFDLYAGSFPDYPHVFVAPANFVSSPVLDLSGDLNVGVNLVPATPPLPVQQSLARLTVVNTRVQVGGKVQIGPDPDDNIYADGWLALDRSQLVANGGINVVRGPLSLIDSTVTGYVSLQAATRLHSAGSTVDGNVSVHDAYIELGVGSLTITGDLTISQSSPSLPDFMRSGLLLAADSSGAVSKVTVNGELNLTGGLQFYGYSSGVAWQLGQSFDLLDFDPARVSGTFDRLYLPKLSAGQSWDTSQLYTTGVVQIVPEPSAFATSGFALSCFARAARRRLGKL